MSGLSSDVSSRPSPALARTVARRAAREYVTHARYVARWLVLVAPVAALVGSAVALFLWALDAVTQLRWAHPWLLWLLPLGGVAIGALYQAWGRSAEGGNNLIVDEIHAPGGGVPGRMTPLVLVGTLATHLFGGSAGREGTAVQMGGSIASTLERLLFSRLRGSLHVDDEDRRVLLQTGVAAGFGAVFGTPITGAVFALEVLAIGRLSYAALVPCLLGALLGDWVTAAWGIGHTRYEHLALDVLGVGHLDLLLLAKVAVAAAAFGLASTLFAETTHGVGRVVKRLIPRPWLRPAVGGAVVIALTLAVGTRDYLGLGVASPDPHGVSILSSFQDVGAGGIPPWCWALKLLFTAVTLGSGFKGGEVTPLFFVGAALGHALAGPLHAPVALFAALGFVAVFAGATNTPLACTIMGVELFGADAAVYLAAACFLAYLFSGHSGIYLAQRLGTPKGDLGDLGDLGAARPAAAPTTGDVAPSAQHVTLRDLHARPARDTRGGLRTVPRSPHAVASMPAPASEPRSTRRSSPHDPSAAVSHQHHVPGHPHHGHVEPAWPTRPVAVARLYLSPRYRRPGAGWWARTFGRPLSADVVLAAKRFGLPHALVLQARFGYVGHGSVVSDETEHGPLLLTQCVELTGAPAQVEAFCRAHGELLAGHPLVVHAAEQWELPSPAAHWVDAVVRAHAALG